MSYLPYAVALWLFLVGLYGIITSRHLLHLVICLSVVQSSTYLLFLAVGYRRGGQAPILTEQAASQLTVDPVTQALVLTDIVVGATMMALLLAMAVQIHKHRNTLDPEELPPMRG